jgi:hypothetical protein
MVSSEIVFGGAILGVALIYGIYEYATKETSEELRYPSFSRYIPQYDNNNNIINDRYSSFSNVQQAGSRRNRRKNRKTKRT